MLSKNLQSRFQPPSRAMAGAEQLVSSDFDGVFQKKARAIGVADEAEAFELPGVGSVGGFGGRGEPALVNTAAMAAESVEVVGMQPKPATRDHKGSRNPVWFQPENSSSVADGVTDLRLVQHLVDDSFFE